MRNLLTNQPHYVVAYKPTGEYCATISGMGRNRGTLDSSHSRCEARRYAMKLSRKDVWRDFTLRVETMTRDECLGIYRNGKRCAKGQS